MSQNLQELQRNAIGTHEVPCGAQSRGFESLSLRHANQGECHQYVTVPLHPDGFALIDTEDLPKVSDTKWYRWRQGNYFYAKDNKGGLMHRIITNAPKGMVVDHINFDALDNRKSNLRLCTIAQNVRNSRKRPSAASSRYKGVSFYKRYNNWQVQLMLNRKKLHIGYFGTEAEAALAYNAAAKKHFGEFANENTITP